MNESRTYPFVRMNGLGNKITVMDLRCGAKPLSVEDVRAVAANEASAFDQLMVLYPPRTAGTAAFVLIYNLDGSESSACGNGTRCIAWLEAEKFGERRPLFETRAGVLRSQVEDIGHITVDMGQPKFGWEDLPLSEAFHDTRGIELQVGPIDAPVLHSPSVVNVGNPHAIFWVDEDPDTYELERFGPMLENHPLFPERANISIAQVLSREALKVRTWERGVGLTRACGTAACAGAVSAARKRLTGRHVSVSVPGGVMVIDWTAEDRILMSGPVEIEFAGEITLAGHPAAVL